MASTSSTSISLGNISTTNGTTRLSGTNSNLDTDALVTSLVEAKKLPATRLETRITQNDAKVAALGELKTLLSDIRTAIAGLRNPTGSLGIEENLFEKKETYLTSSTTTAGTSILGVSASNRAETGSFQLSVQQLATANKISSDSLAAADQDLADSLGSFSGTLRLGLAGGATADIAIDGTMTLQDVRAAINARSATTGVAATVLTVADGDVRLVLTAKDTGKAITLANAGSDDVLARLGLSSDGGTSAAHTIQAAQNARFTIDGVTLERSSNKVEDAISGLTLNLFKAEPATTVTVEVDRALGDVQQKLADMVDAYNALRDFVVKQNQVDSDGTVSSDSPLYGNTLLRDVQSGIASIFAGSSTGGDTLRDIGISFDSSNKLTVDESKLETALLTGVDKLRDVMEYRFESSSADLALFSHKGVLNDADYAVAIVDADGDGQAESATIDGVAVDVSGRILKGRDGTAYAGLQLIWTGTGSTTISVHSSQGLADKAYEQLTNVLDETDGRLTKEIADIADQSTKAQTDIDKITERTERYREQLVAKFAAMETALGQANAMLAQIKAALGQNDDA